ncbi:MAG: type II secretion system protein, partial [Pirellulales bacterium]
FKLSFQRLSRSVNSVAKNPLRFKLSFQRLSRSVNSVAKNSFAKGTRICQGRRAFTLVELLITVSIVAIMASMVLFALFAAQEQAKVQKTRSLIVRLDSLIRERYDSYRTRRVPIRIPQNTSVRDAGKMRIDALRDLMRMEMPDRWSDVYDDPANFGPTTVARPAVTQAYRNKFIQVSGITAWPPTAPNVFDHQSAECLYMIVMEALAQEGDAREVFKPDSIADTDGDGFPEFIDAWGQPIEFLRWAPGFQSELQTPLRATGNFITVSPKIVTVGATGSRFSASPAAYVGGAIVLIDPTSQIMDTGSMARITAYAYSAPTATFTCETPSYTMQEPFGGNPPSSGEFVVLPPDPFDPRGVYPLYPFGMSSFPPGQPDTSVPTFALYPLIFSAGPDKAYGVKDDSDVDPMLKLHYADPAVALNPFYVNPIAAYTFGLFLGSCPHIGGTEPNWRNGCWVDNIHNHQLNLR